MSQPEWPEIRDGDVLFRQSMDEEPFRWQCWGCNAAGQWCLVLTADVDEMLRLSAEGYSVSLIEVLGNSEET